MDNVFLRVDGDVNRAALEVIQEAKLVRTVDIPVPLANLSVVIFFVVDNCVLINDIRSGDYVVLCVNSYGEGAALKVVTQANLEAAVNFLDPLADFSLLVLELVDFIEVDLACLVISITLEQLKSHLGASSQELGQNFFELALVSLSSAFKIDSLREGDCKQSGSKSLHFCFYYYINQFSFAVEQITLVAYFGVRADTTRPLVTNTGELP